MKKIALFTLLVTMFTACMQDSITELNNQPNNKRYIYATIDEDTRVELNEKKQTVWTEGDQIVRFGNGIYDVWNFTGNTGDRGGSFEFSSAWDYNINYDFSDVVYALYPYTYYYNVGFFEDSGLALFHYVSSAQVYRPNTYDPNSNAMLGTSDDGENFTFRNLMGYLRLSLTGEKSVMYISLKGNNNEILNGIRYFRANDPNECGWYDNLGDTSYVFCESKEGVQLTDTPTEFYFTIPPMVFQRGVSVEVYFTDGTIYPIRTSKEIVIERNTIQPMANVETGNDIEWQTITIQHTGIEVLSIPILLGETNMVGYTYWGDGYMTSIGISGSYVYEDGIDTHEIIIKSQNATYLYIGSCAGISEIDLSNF